MSLRSDLRRVHIINIRTLIVPVVSLALIPPIAYDAWRGEKPGAASPLSHNISAPSKDKSNLETRYKPGAPAVASDFRPSAPGIDTLLDNNYRANELPINIGNTLDADINNGFAEIGNPLVDIGEPLDPDAPITDYTNEPPLSLGERLDANNPGVSNIDGPSAYKNIGKNIIVGEEFNWLDDEPQNIGPLLDVDT